MTCARERAFELPEPPLVDVVCDNRAVVGEHGRERERLPTIPRAVVNHLREQTNVWLTCVP